MKNILGLLILVALAIINVTNVIFLLSGTYSTIPGAILAVAVPFWSGMVIAFLHTNR